MKLRIRDNSIRLRLERGEVDRLRDAGLVVAKTGFAGGGELGYAVESSAASDAPEALLSGSTVTVRLPESTVLAWADSEQVSIVGEQPLAEGDMLAILVEKDFACLAPREGEDESDMFPHPDGGTDAGQC